METSNLKKADPELVNKLKSSTDAIAKSGKQTKVVGVIRNLPLSAIDAKHFEDHKSEFVWRSDPVGGVREDINGLYAGIWITDKYDHIPMVFVSAEVLHAILYPKKVI